MPERNEALVRLQELYESYLGEVELLELNRKPSAGIFGLKGGPADDPCHDRFAETLHGFYEGFAAQKPESAAVKELMAYACTLPTVRREPRTAYWMLIAVQSLTQELVGLLTPSDAEELAVLYEKSFRRRERMPAQIKLIKALKAAGKA
ncbi:MAG: hypothetical protein IJQ36_06070 [Oscillospiraceae bacterium]|nr:hypothetical protein [Oscillospiraceae bacterium]